MKNFKKLFEEQEQKQKDKEEEQKKKKKDDKSPLKKDFESNKGTAEGVMEAVIEDVEEMKNFIVFMFGSVAQFHIYHLLTRNGTHHTALGEFYTGLQSSIDSICEQVLAGQRFESMSEEDEGTYGNEIEFYYDHADCIEDIGEVSAYATDMIRAMDGIENLALVNELTDIKELCDKTLYKMNLS